MRGAGAALASLFALAAGAALPAGASGESQAIYVLSQDDAILSIIDPETDILEARIALTGKPASFTLRPAAMEASRNPTAAKWSLSISQSEQRCGV